MNGFSPEERDIRPHPLAEALIDRLSAAAHPRVLEIGGGSGRNRNALQRAGFEVHSFDAPPEANREFQAALSTHALLHGTQEDIAASLARIARALESGAPLFATFGSRRDFRYGTGRQIDRHTFAAESGEESGVPHTYFDAEDLRERLVPLFGIESLREVCVDDVVGRWAHARPSRGRFHFFVIACTLR